MRLFIQLVITCFFFVGSVPLVQANQANTIIVVTDNAHPVVNLPKNVRLIKLDEAERLHEQLSANLPSDPKQATEVAKSRLATSDHLLQQALQDVVDAWALGVSKIPAVIVNNHVVYGESDVKHAVSMIKSYQEQNP